MQIFAQSNRSQESLCRAASGTATHCELVECESGLLFPVHVYDVVAHFLASLQESYAERGVVGRVLDC